MSDIWLLLLGLLKELDWEYGGRKEKVRMSDSGAVCTHCKNRKHLQEGWKFSTAENKWPHRTLEVVREGNFFTENKIFSLLKEKKKHHNKQTTCTQTPETAKFPVRICFSLIGRERSVGGVASSFSQTEGLWGWTRGGWSLCNIRRHICSVCTGISKLKNLFLKKRLKTVLWLKLISLAWKDRLLLLSVWCLNQSNLILLLFSVLLCQHC